MAIIERIEVLNEHGNHSYDIDINTFSETTKAAYINLFTEMYGELPSSVFIGNPKQPAYGKIMYFNLG